jgi:hypothetical protein
LSDKSDSCRVPGWTGTEKSHSMKNFTIDAENNITVHASRKAARETGAGVFATEEQFADLIGPDSKRLVEIWNSLSGVKAVTKFNSRKTATERIWKAIQNLGEATPTGAVETATGGPQTPQVATEEAPAKTRRTRAKKPTAARTTAPGPRDGSKTSRVIELLKREGGVTLQELMTEMGWQSHTTRALMSAGGALAKKHGLTVVSTKSENGDRIYSISA